MKKTLFLLFFLSFSFISFSANNAKAAYIYIALVAQIEMGIFV